MGNCEQCFAVGFLGARCDCCPARPGYACYVLEDTDVLIDACRLARLLGVTPDETLYDQCAPHVDEWHMQPTTYGPSGRPNTAFTFNDLSRTYKLISIVEIMRSTGPSHPGLTWFFYSYFWPYDKKYHNMWFPPEPVDYDDDLFSTGS